MGTFTVTGSTLNIVGSFTTAQVESIAYSTTQVTLGSDGVVDNRGDTLDLNATTGNWRLDGGTIRRRHGLGTAGAKLVAAANGNNRLDGVTLQADLDLSANSAKVGIENGLTLDGTAN